MCKGTCFIFLLFFLFFVSACKTDPSSSAGKNSIDSTGTVTDIDGNVYKTIKIGSQWWMAENLKAVRFQNGDSIYHETQGQQWINLTSEAYCAYLNDDNNADVYGLLYNWFAVNDSRGLAPAGWHIPSDEEWKQLEMHLGMDRSEADEAGTRGTVEGGKLKMTGTIEEGSGLWFQPNTGADNESGFAALPGGRRGSAGAFLSKGSHAFFWSSTSFDGVLAWSRSLHYFDSGCTRESRYKGYGFSIRCIKD